MEKRMGLGTTLLLGLIAGGTIVLGMPVGRLRTLRPTMQVFLNAVAIGVLLFLLWDVMSAAWEPTDDALSATHEGTGGFGSAIGYGLLFALCLGFGLLSLVAYERWMSRIVTRARARVPADPIGASAAATGGASVAAGAEGPPAGKGPVQEDSLPGLAGWSPARRLALLIAVGIGAHNFAEGLAIGQSAASDDIALATVLVIGFALHNATEGFGIVAPLAGDVDDEGQRRMPSWGFLLTLAAIGGGPTFVGTWIGHGFDNTALAVVCLSLAAGSILYVIVQMVVVASRARRPDVLACGLLLGLFAGFLTDGILVAAGA
jgi:zinc transporter, ZIP family